MTTAQSEQFMAALVDIMCLTFMMFTLAINCLS